MSDLIEKIGKSLIQHGKINNRIYIMKLFPNDAEKVMDRCTELCKINNYSKIFAKVPNKIFDLFKTEGFEVEAKIPNFYKGEEDCVFLAKYLDSNREKLENHKELINVQKIVKKKESIDVPSPLSKNYKMQIMTKSDTKLMAELYKKVFNSYPFPIFDEAYLAQTMDEGVKYAGIWHENRLISLASAETCFEFKNSEMTDFATLSEYRGNNLALNLLKFLESKLIIEGYKTLYTIARANSIGMNATFKKNNYEYAGLLKNNTNIGGSIESMNVWYKEL